MTNRGLILDLDNTLYNWIDAFIPSFRAMIHKLAAEVHTSEEEILIDYSNVYRVHGTVEYPKATYELALWNRLGIPEAEKGRTAQLVEKIFSINYRQHLHLFPNVAEVLKWAQEEGIMLVGLSDALERWVCYRLRLLGIEKYFQGLYTWHHDPWFEDRTPSKSSIRIRVKLVGNELKPNREVLDRVIRDFILDRNSTYMVGDSLSKDIVAAQSAGVHDVWARYGTRPKEDNLDTLRQITPWSEEKKTAEREARGRINPTHTIDDFGQLIDLLGSHRLTLFD